LFELQEIEIDVHGFPGCELHRLDSFGVCCLMVLGDYLNRYNLANDLFSVRGWTKHSSVPTSNVAVWNDKREGPNAFALEAWCQLDFLEVVR
jgi:hypothetical protein